MRLATSALAAVLLLACGLARALPQADQDFWTWLAPQLQLGHIQHPDIDAWEARYRERQVELQVTLLQGREFLYPLALAVRDRGMPLEIALLPVVESQLDPTAVSRSGARGLWQLLPATAEHLGLQHDWWYDDSADFNRSTDAALNYLGYLHERFGGWLLGLAAYNAGEGRIARQMRERRRRGLTVDYWDLELKTETRAYVPKLLALARIIRNPGTVRLPPVSTRRTFVRLNTEGPLDITQIASLSGVDIERIYRLNPQLRRWATPPRGPHAIYLPIEASQPFSQALRELPADQRRRWRRHTVQPGETLGMIATRHGSSVALIQRLNDMNDVTIRPGQQLILADHDRQLNRLSVNAAIRQGRLSYAQRPMPGGWHEVRSGDSLWSIAQQYGTSTRTLLAQNSLAGGHRLIPGQLIRIGGADQRRRVYYEVQPGDMLSLIAERYRVSVNDIRSWNGIDGSLLRPGQTLELRLPPSAG